MSTNCERKSADQLRYGVLSYHGKCKIQVYFNVCYDVEPRSTVLGY